MEHDFLGLSSGKFPGATEHLNRFSLYAKQNIPKQNLCLISSKPTLIPVSGLRCHFLVNGSDLYKINGECDSRVKLTSPEFCIPFAQTMDQPVCPSQASKW